MMYRPTAWACLLILAFTPPVLAVPLPPGGAVIPDAQALPGAAIASQTLPFAGINALGETVFTGSLLNQVYREATGNLVFTYQFSNNASSSAEINRLSTLDFAGFTTDAGFVAGTGVVPLQADRSGAVNGGRTIGFDNFGGSGGSVLPGQSSAVLLIRTNATEFDNNGATQLIDGGVASVRTFAPLAIVPEPGSFALACIGVSTAAWVAYRRRRRAAGGANDGPA